MAGNDVGLTGVFAKQVVLELRGELEAKLAVRALVDLADGHGAILAGSPRTGSTSTRCPGNSNDSCPSSSHRTRNGGSP